MYVRYNYHTKKLIQFTIFEQNFFQQKSYSSPTYPLARLEDGGLLARKDKQEENVPLNKNKKDLPTTGEIPC